MVKFIGIVDIIQNISAVILHSINEPSDIIFIPFNRINVVFRWVVRSAVTIILMTIVVPVHGAISHLFVVYMFHYVDLSRIEAILLVQCYRPTSRMQAIFPVPSAI